MQRAAGHGTVPDGWQRVRLGDVADIRKGQSFTSKDLIPGDVPVIAGGTSPAYFHALSNRPADTVTVSASGAHAGFVAFHKQPIFATDCSTVQGEKGGPVINFVFHFLKNAQKHIYYRRRGSAQPHVYPDDIAILSILLPPLPEQRAIAAVLDSIDDAIEGTEAVIAATEQLRNSLLHDLLTRGVPGWHTEWKDVLGLGTIPADWEMVRLGEVAEVIMGQSPPGLNCNRDGEGIPLLNGPTEYGPNHPEPAQWTTDARKISQEGDVLFCVRGATAGRMNWADRDYAIGRGVAAIRHKSGSSFRRYLRALLDFRMPELLSVVTGSTFPNLSYEQITQLRVPGIPSVQQQAIATALDGVDAALDVAREELAGLRLLKESTADALLTGRVRIGGKNE